MASHNGQQHRRFVNPWLRRLLILLALLAGLWWLLTSNGQSNSSRISSQDVTTARKVLSGTLRQLGKADDRIELHFEQAQLDALMDKTAYDELLKNA